MIDYTNLLRQSYEGRSILVTGGAGFVGSQVSGRLIQLGAKVTVLDDFTTGREELVPAGAVLVRGSVTDGALVLKLAAESDYIVHMAARVLASSTSDLHSDSQVNIGGMINVLSAAREHSAKVKRVIYSSTTSIYGNARSLPVHEDERPNILSPYAASKFAAESYCNVFYEMFGTPVSIVRYSNVYGPHQSPRNPYCGVISKFFTACYQNEPMCIHGSGMQTRDFTFVEDAVTATLLAGVVPRAEGSIFNVGTGVEVNIVQLAEAIDKAAGTNVGYKFIDRRDIDNVTRRVVNVEHARQILRWVPNVGLATGLKRTHEWLLQDRARA
ncbi:MAG TPA: NAD-dependent epimerase/dehydratase family protein [Verrucomicrobiales bacterium]|jgi:UDP-glucose 4-epimerase|nr:NAD-dependent epimerase/dehydratase family protein [Verrucomicrobiales bacterium]